MTFIYFSHVSSGLSRVYRVTQLRTGGVHCRESTATGPVVLQAKSADGQRGHHVTHLHECLGATQVSVRLSPVQPSFDSSTRRAGVATAGSTLPCTITTFPVSLPLSLLAKTCRVYLLFPPPRGHKPPPTFHGCLIRHLCLQHLRFPIPRYTKRPDVTLYAIRPLFLHPTPTFTYSNP